MKKAIPLLSLFMLANFSFAQKTALHFDGVNDYLPITGTTKLNSLSKITVETWVYITNPNSSPCADCAPIIWNQQNSYRFGTGNSMKVYFSVMNSGTPVTISSANSFSDSSWHHIAGTFDGTELKLYIDGNATDSFATSTFNINYPSNSSDVWIVDPATGYEGVLEETRIWDYARTPAQIKEGTYRRFKVNTPGLVLQLSYEDGSAYADNSSVTTALDETSFNHDGAIKNFNLKDSASNFILGRTYCDTVAYAKYSITRCIRYTLPSKKKSITSSGVYQDTIASYRGCDSVMTITVKINKPSATSINLIGCDSVQHPITKNYHKTSGKSIVTLLNYVGCDSVVTYNITVLKKDTTYINEDVCNSYTLGSGKVITSTGVYIDDFKGYRGCDSIVEYTLKIRKTTLSQVTLKMCKFVLSPTDNQVVYRKIGIYYDTLTNKSLCDSVIEYNVISASSYSNINTTSCGPMKSPSNKYTWNSSGIFYDTLFSANYLSCDSFITINLTIDTAEKKTIFVSECRSYLVPSGAKRVFTSGVVNDAIKSTMGCDSIKYTINVTITPANTGISRTGNTLTATSMVTGASFSWLNCSNNMAAIPGETSKSFNPASSGNFALAVKENNCTDTSNCYNFVFNGTENMALQGLRIYPNPGNGKIDIQSAFLLHDVRVLVLNTMGEVLRRLEFPQLSQQSMALDLPAAIYLLKIESKEGSMVKSLVVE